MDDGRVSVIITTYYRNDTLGAAIESALRQTYPNIEIIVVDDSGERFAEDIVDRYEVTYVAHDKNLGANPARNTGLEYVTGKYVQFLDDDDTLDPTKTEKQVELLNASEDVGVVYCGLEAEDHCGKVRSFMPRPEVRGDITEYVLAIDSFPAVTSTLLVEHEILKKILPIEDRPGVGDIWMKLELALRTDYDYVDESLVVKNVDPGLGRGIEALNEKLKLVNDYQHVYERYQPELFRSTKSDIYYSIGRHILLNEGWWSVEALRALFKSFLYTTKGKWARGTLALGAVFGRPGFALIRRYHLSKTCDVDI